MNNTILKFRNDFQVMPEAFSAKQNTIMGMLSELDKMVYNFSAKPKPDIFDHFMFMHKVKVKVFNIAVVQSQPLPPKHLEGTSLAGKNGPEYMINSIGGKIQITTG